MWSRVARTATRVTRVSLSLNPGYKRLLRMECGGMPPLLKRERVPALQTNPYRVGRRGYVQCESSVASVRDRRVEQQRRIHEGLIQTHAPVQMGPRDTAGHADAADLCTTLDRRAGGDVDVL